MSPQVGLWFRRERGGLGCDGRGKGKLSPACHFPQLPTHSQPQSACPAWSHWPSKACTPAYNASNLWRSCTAIDSPAKCMVLCHVMATAYAKPVCVHNVCCQTAWLCIVGHAITFLLTAFFCNSPPSASLMLALTRRWWKRAPPPQKLLGEGILWSVWRMVALTTLASHQHPIKADNAHL